MSATDSNSTSLLCKELTGLRGIAALWVMIFHCVIYSTTPIDLQGSSIMPLFFLLSGVTLTIGYYEQFSDQQSTNLTVVSHPQHNIGYNPLPQEIELSESINNQTLDETAPPTIHHHA